MSLCSCKSANTLNCLRVKVRRRVRHHSLSAMSVKGFILEIYERLPSTICKKAQLATYSIIVIVLIVPAADKPSLEEAFGGPPRKLADSVFICVFADSGGTSLRGRWPFCTSAEQTWKKIEYRSIRGDGDSRFQQFLLPWNRKVWPTAFHWFHPTV